MKTLAAVTVPSDEGLSTEQIIRKRAASFFNKAVDFLVSEDYSKALDYLDKAMYLDAEIEQLQSLRIRCLRKVGKVKQADYVEFCLMQKGRKG
ncbi:MAG: hypothetical protein HPY45_01460 [Anaerolineae bacterium]|nr:hypothetical protein [Anaerolineae bacterium]